MKKTKFSINLSTCETHEFKEFWAFIHEIETTYGEYYKTSVDGQVMFVYTEDEESQPL